MYHAKFWPFCLFETCKQNNNIYSWQLDIFPNGSVLTVCLKEHLSLPTDHDCASTIGYIQTPGEFSAREKKLFGFYLLQLLAGSGSQWAWGWLWERKLTHLLPGFSRSRSLRTDLPSTSGGGSSPAMSRIVGARSMFRTICGTLQRHRWLCRRARSSGGGPGGLLLHTMTRWPLVPLPSPGLRGRELHLATAEWSAVKAWSKINWLSQGSLERCPDPWALATLSHKSRPDNGFWKDVVFLLKPDSLAQPAWLRGWG